MKNAINTLEKEILSLNKCIVFNNAKLNTIVYTKQNSFYNDLTKFSKVFNDLFKSDNNNNNNNILECYLIEDEKMYYLITDYLINGNLITTSALDKFNNATINTSLAKCSKDYSYYFIKCYDYFIYVFDKKKKKCYMIVKNNKKALTMINILILTPYLLYGELYAVHGGLVTNGNCNVLINNSSLGGKTTFAILFASNGWKIITEETTYITKNGEILPFNIRNYFNIRIGTYLNFLDFFVSKNIIIENFIKLKGKTSDELFNIGKEGQTSIDFDKIGAYEKLNNKYITTSLKVTIQNNQHFEILKCSPLENVKSFLELSLAPTVLLFEELLNFDIVNKKKRENNLKSIFKMTNSYIINSNFDYKKQFKQIECLTKKEY